MDFMTSGRTFFASLVLGGGSYVYAAINSEALTIVGGIALGTMGAVWSIYRSSNDQRFETILKRLDKAEAEVDEYRGKLKAVNDNLVTVNMRLSEVTGNYDLLKKRLATHVCPIPADAAVKCSLPEIINITL